jgi:2-amino-4-hydroxy-6-hydroxymethyldihydropteridine diphosphokinase
MTLAYLGLGANLGDAKQTMQDAIADLARHPQLTVRAKSSFYRSAPVDAPGHDYTNCAIAIATALLPYELLALCATIEHRFGRRRPYPHAPRPLDIDIFLYGRLCFNEAKLVIPHPRLTQRAFALIPLLELDPDIDIPQYGRADTFLPSVLSQRIEKMR